MKLSLFNRKRPAPLNCPDTHQAKVNEAIERMGERYLCHPANRVKPIWRTPCGTNRAA